MITPKKSVLLRGVILLWAAPTGRALVIGDADYTYAFTNGQVALWDISGSYNETDVGLNLDYSLNMQPSGKFAGTGAASFSDGADSLQGQFIVAGALKSSGNVVRVNMTIKMTGDGQVSDNYGYSHYATFQATVKETVELDPVSRQLIGTSGGKVTVAIPDLKKKKTVSIPKGEVQDNLPADATGDWSLSVDLTLFGAKWTGNANIESSSQTLPLAISGTYAPRTGLSKLALKSLGMGLNLVVNDEGTLLSMKGKALGQKLKLPTGP